MSLFQREPKTVEQVTEAVDKAVKGASTEMSKVNDTRSDVERIADNIPTLAAGVAAVETVVEAGKGMFDAAKTAVVDFTKSEPVAETPDNSGVDFGM